jgi:hypothetical protein
MIRVYREITGILKRCYSEVQTSEYSWFVLKRVSCFLKAIWYLFPKISGLFAVGIHPAHAGVLCYEDRTPPDSTAVLQTTMRCVIDKTKMPTRRKSDKLIQELKLRGLRKRTIPTERPPFVGEVSAIVYG